MPRRNLVFANDQIYHVFNRTVGNTDIFSTKAALHKALKIINFYRFPQKIRLSQFKLLSKEVKDIYQKTIFASMPLVEIYAFALMPNHHHFLLKQKQDRGIVNFTSRFQNSFAKVFNLINDRSGTLFQAPFKAKRIETDETFMHISRYIHLNPVTAYLIQFEELTRYPWTSFRYYQKQERNSFVDTEFLLQFFESPKKYSEFVANQVNYQRSLDLLKHFTLEK